MAILTVGTNEQYSTVAAAVAAAHDGDVVQVQAGTYTNDFPTITSKITLQAVGGLVNMVATVAPPNGKAILTVDNDAKVVGFDFSGAKVYDANGAGIRYEGGNLDLENCSFHDNENGVMSAPIDGGVLTINNCDFYHNGNGNGLTHNLYVGNIDTVTITNSTFTDAVVGHEIKSRAQNTIIENNTISDGPTGTASYSIDLPNGGNALVANNTIEKGPNAENQAIIHFGGEGIAYAGSQLTVSGNTITNDLTAHQTVAVFNQTLIDATVTGNTFLGVPISTYASGPATLTNNSTADGALPDSNQTDIGGTGNTVYITDPGDQNVTLPGSFYAIKAGAGHLTATGWSHETVVGGAGGLTWNGQDGADTIYTAAGVANTINLGHANNGLQSAGTDTVNLGTGNNGIKVQGTATLTGGTGANTIEVDGTATIANSGTDYIYLAANGHATITDSGYVQLSSNGGTFSLTQQAPGQAVANSITIQGGAASLMGPVEAQAVTMAGGSKGAAITLGTGNHQIISGGAPDTIRAGSGVDTVVIAGNAQVYQGTGTLTVFGRGIAGMATVHGSAGTMTLDGDTGNIRYQSEGGPATLNDRLGNTVVVGGSSRLTVNALAGHLNIQGGTGGIVVNDSTGGHTISTAAGARDTLNLLGGSTVTSNGTDQITLNSSDNFTVTANGTATIRGGTGANVFNLNGNDTLLARSANLDRTTVGAKANVQLSSISARDIVGIGGGTLGYTSADNSNGSLLTNALKISGFAQLDRSNGQVALVTTQSGAATSVTANSSAQIFSNGNDTIQAGAFIYSETTGRASVTLGAGGGYEKMLSGSMATITGGSGAVTVDASGSALTFVGGSGSAVIGVGSGTASVTAGKGNMTLQGGSGAMTVKGGSGSAVLNDGSGPTTVLAGAGATTVNCGAGRELLQVQAHQAHGLMVVNDFNTATDSIQLQGYAAGSSKVSSYAGGTMLTLSDGTKMQFNGVSKLPGFP